MDETMRDDAAVEETSPADAAGEQTVEQEASDTSFSDEGAQGDGGSPTGESAPQEQTQKEGVAAVAV